MRLTSHWPFYGAICQVLCLFQSLTLALKQSTLFTLYDDAGSFISIWLINQPDLREVKQRAGVHTARKWCGRDTQLVWAAHLGLQRVATCPALQAECVRGSLLPVQRQTAGSPWGEGRARSAWKTEARLLAAYCRWETRMELTPSLSWTASRLLSRTPAPPCLHPLRCKLRWLAISIFYGDGQGVFQLDAGCCTAMLSLNSLEEMGFKLCRGY